jgi:hypothetical protein
VEKHKEITALLIHANPNKNTVESIHRSSNKNNCANQVEVFKSFVTVSEICQSIKDLGERIQQRFPKMANESSTYVTAILKTDVGQTSKGFLLKILTISEL